MKIACIGNCQLESLAWYINYFLKLLKLICEDFNWKYFSKEEHEMFLNVGFPHGVNLK